MKYKGVIEDNNDPLKLSRVRVRVFGLHTQNNENSIEKFNTVKSNELPWAEVQGGTDFGLISGVGVSSVLRQGTWVWIELDHDNPNKPVVVGVVKGRTKTRTIYANGEGFNDKDGVYPLQGRLEESDLNRISTQGNLNDVNYNSVHKKINDNLDNVVSVDAISGANVSQIEPTSTSDLGKYPDVAVIETQSGHTIEIDDSTNNERIRITHKTGSYIEFKPDGTIVQKSSGLTGTNHYIHMSDVEKHIAKGVKEYIEQNKEEIIGGSLLTNVKGNLNLHVQGNLNWVVDGTISLTSTGNYAVSAPRIDLN